MLKKFKLDGKMGVPLKHKNVKKSSVFGLFMGKSSIGSGKTSLLRSCLSISLTGVITGLLTFEP